MQTRLYSKVAHPVLNDMSLQTTLYSEVAPPVRDEMPSKNQQNHLDTGPVTVILHRGPPQKAKQGLFSPVATLPPFTTPLFGFLGWASVTFWLVLRPSSKNQKKHPYLRPRQRTQLRILTSVPGNGPKTPPSRTTEVTNFLPSHAT